MSEASNQGVGKLLADNKCCPEIRVKNKIWKVGHPTQAAKARLEKLVAKVALDEVRNLKEVLSPDAYQEAFSEAVRSLKDYRTWKPGWQKIIEDPNYFHLHLLSLLQEHHPEATEDDARELLRSAPEEVVAAFTQILPDFFRLLLAELKGLIPEEKYRKAQEEVENGLTRLLQQFNPTAATSAQS